MKHATPVSGPLAISAHGWTWTDRSRAVSRWRRRTAPYSCRGSRGSQPPLRRGQASGMSRGPGGLPADALVAIVTGEGGLAHLGASLRRCRPAAPSHPVRRCRPAGAWATPVRHCSRRHPGHSGPALLHRRLGHSGPALLRRRATSPALLPVERLATPGDPPAPGPTGPADQSPRTHGEPIPSPGARSRTRRTDATILFHVDLEALRRGALGPGEECTVEGAGHVQFSVVQQYLDTARTPGRQKRL